MSMLSGYSFVFDALDELAGQASTLLLKIAIIILTKIDIYTKTEVLVSAYIYYLVLARQANTNLLTNF